MQSLAARHWSACQDISAARAGARPLTWSAWLIALALGSACSLGACGTDNSSESAQGGQSAQGGAAGGAPTHGFDPADLPSITFGAYHSYAETAEYLRDVSEVAQGITSYAVLGQSVEGRDIPYLVINATAQDSPAAVFLNGAHHGDEHPSSEALLAFVDHVLRHLDDPVVSDGLGRYAVYVLPIVNPDGFEAETRDNAHGVDLNRDYAGPTIAEAAAFSQVETQAMKQLIDQSHFVAAAALHSSPTAEEVLWPWGYSAEPTADAAELAAIGESTALAMGLDRYLQSYADYPTSGEFLDYAYFKTHTLAFTLEVSVPKKPSVSALPGIVAAAVAGTLAMLQELHATEAGSAQARISAGPSFGLGHVAAVDANGGKLE